MSIASPAEPLAAVVQSNLTRWRWALLFGSLLVMLMFLGEPAVLRSQEARVLETAREMMGSGWRGWMIPRLNDTLRLEKPPMAYWLSAVAFYVGGVNECVGRVPFAIAAWATLIVTYVAGTWLFGPRAGYLAAGVLMAGLLFGRNGRLAETDVLATLFVTAAIYCIWRGVQEEIDQGTLPANWFRLSGVMTGLAVFAKGLPAVFIVIFLVALATSRRDWRMLWRWTRSGAPLLAILIAAPWFAYIFATVGLKVIRSEAEIGVMGKQHNGPVFQYAPDLLRATAPWSALAVLALVIAAMRWRTDWRLRGALIWFAAIMVPLCIAGQRQFHYLFPAMPVLAILTGWLLDDAASESCEHRGWVRTFFFITIAVLTLGMVLAPLAGRYLRDGGGLRGVDFILAAVGATSGVVSLVLLRRGYGNGLAFAVGGVAVAMSVLVQLWLPTLDGVTPRAVAAQIRTVGPGPYYFYGENISLPLVFSMQTVMPRLFTPEELTAVADAHPSLLAVMRGKSGVAPPPLPAGFEEALDIDTKDGEFRVFRRPHAPASPPLPGVAAE